MLTLQASKQKGDTMKFIKRIGAMFGRNPASSDEHLLHWAKVEYKKDWEYAYHHMRTNSGQPPRYVYVKDNLNITSNM